METVFKVGDKVFDIQFGWGEVYTIDSEGHYPVCVSYEETKTSYTNDGRRHISGLPTLSFTKYTLDGFSQERPIDYSEYIGKWGLFWDDEDEDRFIGKLKCFVYGAFQTDKGVYADNFKPLTDEQVKMLEL